MAFVVPDKSMETASSFIQKAGFAACVKGLDCPVLNGYWGKLPIEHWHINDELEVLLYQKSDVLSQLSFSNGDWDLLNASDKRLPSAVPGQGWGHFLPEFSFVQIPHLVQYCEAVIRLLCQDYGTRSGNYWMAILTYITDYMDETDIFNEQSLGEEYRLFYRALKEGEFLRMYLLLDELCKDLIWSHSRLTTRN